MLNVTVTSHWQYDVLDNKSLTAERAFAAVLSCMNTRTGTALLAYGSD